MGPAYGNPVRRQFVERLLAIAPPPLERVFLSNSGTEAVEAALKFARAATGRPGVVAFRRGFHGRTMGALSATWRKELREPYEPLVPGFSHVAYNDVEAIERAVTDATAAVLVEPVQGEGGVYLPTAEFLAAARSACDRVGALLIVDEVQTGLGRTGRRFAIERWGVAPDVLTLAKSLAGGVPVGATLTSPAVEERFVGSHTSTFGGNPLACAAGLAALRVLERDRLWERAERLGEQGLGYLRGLSVPTVREVRGVGLMIGIELKVRAAPLLDALTAEGVLAISAGANVIRLLPPLVIPETDWVHGLETVGEVLARG